MRVILLTIIALFILGVELRAICSWESRRRLKTIKRIWTRETGNVEYVRR